MLKFSALLLAGLVLVGCGEAEPVIQKDFTYYPGVITEVGTCTGGGGISVTSIMGIRNQADYSYCKVRIKSELSVNIWEMRGPLMAGENVEIQCWTTPADKNMRCQVL